MVSDTTKLLDNIQYFISSVLAICFAIGIFPFFYKTVLKVVVVCLMIQIIISILRGRLLNVFFEIFLVGLAGISLVPVIGLVTSFIAMVLCILEMAAFKNKVLYKQMDTRAFTSKKNPTSKGTRKSKEIKKDKVKFEDAEFNEK